MSFSKGNDLNILQASDSSNVGAGEGDDSYILSGNMIRANQKITITDTQGNNKLQLVGGLEIASSVLTATALKLTLSNGAEVTLLGANSFNFVTGGSSLTGVGGLTKEFSSFATDILGFLAVPTDTTPVAGVGKSILSTGLSDLFTGGITTPTEAPTTVPTEAPTINVTAAGTYTLTSAANVVTVSAGNYDATIQGFAVGDKIDLPTSFLNTLTISNNSSTDGSLLLQGNDETGNAITLTLTGISATNDANIYSVASFQTVFGADSLF